MYAGEDAQTDAEERGVFTHQPDLPCPRPCIARFGPSGQLVVVSTKYVAMARGCQGLDHKMRNFVSKAVNCGVLLQERVPSIELGSVRRGPLQERRLLYETMLSRFEIHASQLDRADLDRAILKLGPVVSLRSSNLGPSPNILKSSGQAASADDFSTSDSDLDSESGNSDDSSGSDSDHSSKEIFPGGAADASVHIALGSVAEDSSSDTDDLSSDSGSHTSQQSDTDLAAVSVLQLRSAIGALKASDKFPTNMCRLSGWSCVHVHVIPVVLSYCSKPFINDNSSIVDLASSALMGRLCSHQSGGWESRKEHPAGARLAQDLSHAAASDGDLAAIIRILSVKTSSDEKAADEVLCRTVRSFFGTDTISNREVVAQKKILHQRRARSQSYGEIVSKCPLGLIDSTLTYAGPPRSIVRRGLPSDFIQAKNPDTVDMDWSADLVSMSALIQVQGTSSITTAAHLGKLIYPGSCFMKPNQRSLSIEWDGTCSICEEFVKGGSIVCPTCGHGGHTLHMQQWFANMDECPSGCGCDCRRSMVAFRS